MAFLSIILFLSLLLNLTSAHPQPSHLTPRASPGCGKPPFFQWFPIRTLTSSGQLRSYTFHLPSPYDPSKTYPVVLAFHGSSSIGTFLELDTKMSQPRYSGDKIMIYPNGEGGSWAGPSYHNGSTVAEDVQFVRDVIEDVKSEFCVDEDKVFGVGFSNGGGFIGTLACDPVGSTLFKAVAAHSGAFYTDVNGPDNGCAPAKIVPMLEIHGAADSTVKYGGGKGDGGSQPAISDWLAWWALRNGCTSKTEETLEKGIVHRYSWTCGGKPGLLQHYKIDKTGHCWADTEGNVSQLTVPQGPTVVRASEIVMKFFDSMA